MENRLSRLKSAYISDTSPNVLAFKGRTLANPGAWRAELVAILCAETVPSACSAPAGGVPMRLENRDPFPITIRPAKTYEP
jgi:hypothetical protein